MFNDFNSGSYLIGHAYPRRQVFIDGRTEFYGPKFFHDYVDIGDGKASRIAEAVERYGLGGFFLTNSTTDLHTGLLKYLFNDPGWGLVYFDDDAVIFLKKTPENQALLEQYQIDLKNWSPRVPDFQKLGIAFRFPAPFIKRAQLLDSLGCYVAAAREARLALEIQTNNAEALKILSNYYYETGDYEQAFKFARNSLLYVPGDIFMRSRLALIYHALGEDEKALKVIDAVIKKSPKYPGGYYAKAKIIRDKDPAQAKKLCARAIEIRDKEPKYRVLMGELLEQEGDLQAAKKEWAAAFEYDATNQVLAKKL
jgi:hypothetical protein